MESWLEGQEEEMERPLNERMGKVVFAAVVGLLASALAESFYDKYMTKSNDEE